jgi:hypothetical protein
MYVVTILLQVLPIFKLSLVLSLKGVYGTGYALMGATAVSTIALVIM